MLKRITIGIISIFAMSLAAASNPLADGFIDHGVCVPASSTRGAVAAVGANGEDLWLLHFADYRGTYGMYVFDVATGKGEMVETPFKPNDFNNIFASLRSSKNRFYTHHSSHFVEFDPVSRKFTVVKPTHTGMGMAMTEADDGTIYAITYPGSGLISYHPGTGAFKDFGSLRKENWAQYHRTLVADDAGYLYFGVGNTKGQFVIFNPATGEKSEVFAEADRPQGTCPMLFRADDGKVYGTVLAYHNLRNLADGWKKACEKADAPWYEFYRGKFKKLDKRPDIKLAARYETGSQFLGANDFQKKWVIERFDPVDRYARIVSPEGKRTEYKFDYPSEGAHLMSVAATSTGIITGGSSFPMRNFVYDPAKDTMLDRNGCLQWNTVLPYQNHLFIGGYNGGYLVDWTLDAKFDGIPRFIVEAKGNPRYIPDNAAPHVIRPHVLKISTDGKTLLMGGTPEYGSTGGGMLLWERDKDKTEVIPNAKLLKDLSIYSLAVLPDGRIFGGTSVAAGTGGEVKARNALFFEFDLPNRKITWSAPLLPEKVGTYHDLTVSTTGKILGIADREKLFLFDPASKKVEKIVSIKQYGGGAIWQQGPRMFVRRGDEVYILTPSAILKINPETLAVEREIKSPVPVSTGGDVLGDRLYFGSHTHLVSCPLPATEKTGK